MRRHRPLDLFYAAREEESVEQQDHPRQRSSNGKGFIRDIVYPEDNRSASNGLRHSREAQIGNSSFVSSHEATRRNTSTSHLDCSPIPFYSEQPSSLIAQCECPVTAPAPAAAASSPRAFYDAPSMRDSIPALLEQLSKSSSYFPKSAQDAGREAPNQRRRSTQKELAPRRSTEDTVMSADPTEPERSTQRNAVPAKTLFLPVSVSANTSPSFVTLQTSATADEACLQTKQYFTTRTQKHKEQPMQQQHTNERSGMLYVVVQQPATVHVAAYTPTSTSVSSPSPDGTTELSSASQKAEVQLRNIFSQSEGAAAAAAAADAIEMSTSTLPRENSVTHSRRSASRDSRSSHSNLTVVRTSVAEKQHIYPRGSKRKSRTANGVKSQEGYTSVRGRICSTGSDASVVEAERSKVPMSQSSVLSSAVAADAASVTPTGSSQANSSSEPETGSSSAHISSSRMRDLFASVLGKRKNLGNSSNNSRTDSVDTHASTLVSASRDTSLLLQTLVNGHVSPHTCNNQRHPLTISSPLATKPTPRAIVPGSSESRGATPAILVSSSHVNIEKKALISTSSTASAPFADAVMEGGDPLVLRHTIDYLLSKARRLEKENATLWAQTHSWNPQRAITPENVETLVLSSPPQPSRVLAAVPQQPVRKSASIGTLPQVRRSVAAGAVTVATGSETEHDARPLPPRIFFQRQLRSKAAGRSNSLVVTASPASPSSSAASTPSNRSQLHRRHDHHSTPDSVVEAKNRQLNFSGMPHPVLHSITVSPPSAVVETTASITRSENSTTADATAAATSVYQRLQQANDSSLSSASTHISRRRDHQQQEVQSVQRAEAAVQHRSIQHDTAITTDSSSIPETRRQTKGSQSSEQFASDSRKHAAMASSPNVAATVNNSAQVKSLTSSILRTPARCGVHLGESTAAEANHDEASATTPLASTVRSHRSVESRRSIGSMTSRITPLHASVLQAQHQQSSSCSFNHNVHTNNSSSVQHLYHRRRSSTDERVNPSATGAAAANASTSNASFSSLRRPPTYNKQVQTASILSPAEDENDGDTALDSNLDGAATVTSAERTAIIELHTSAAYNRSTVRRLRAYCTLLETTRQQLRRRVSSSSTSPNSRSASLAAAVGAPAAASSGSRVFAPSSRSSSRSAFPLPLAQSSATVGRASAAEAEAVTPSSSQLSRPFFQSEYANPEVDATLHDVEETPATDTMIVLHEDGSGTVTKRVVDGSPSRISISAGRSSSATSLQDPPSHQQQQHNLQQTNAMAFSTVSDSEFDEEDVVAARASSLSSRAWPFEYCPPFFLGPSTAQNSHRAHDEAYSLLNASLLSDGNVREVMVPNVHLGRPLRSDSAISWTAYAEQETRPSDSAPLTQSSVAFVSADPVAGSGRFVIPSPTAPVPREERRLLHQRQHQQQPSISAASARAPLPQQAFSQNVDSKAAETAIASASVKTRFSLTPDPQAATTRASTTSSKRFALPGAHTQYAQVSDVSSSGSSSSKSRRSSNCSGNNSVTARSQREGDDAASTLPTAKTNKVILPPPASAPAPAPAPKVTAAMWDPKGASLLASKSTQQLMSPSTAAENQTPSATVHINPVNSVLSRIIPAPPPTYASTATSNTTVNTTASVSSSQLIPDHDVDNTTPKEVTATYGAPSAISAFQTRCSTRVTESDASNLSNSRKSHSEPGSPLQLSPSGGKAASINSNQVHFGKRSSSAEFFNEEEEKVSPHELVRSQEFVSSPFVLVKNNSYNDDEDDSGNADSFSGSEVEEADELLVPEPIPIDRGDSVSSDAGRTQEPQPAHASLRLTSPSPLRKSNAPPTTEDNEGVFMEDGEHFADGFREETGTAENAVDISETSSRCRRRTMPPMQRPPIAPSRETQLVGQDSPSSTSLSRSLYSFTSSSDSDAEDGADSMAEQGKEDNK